MVGWYSLLFKNISLFFVIHTVKGFSIISEAEVDVFFWNCFVFFMILGTLTDFWFLCLFETQLVYLEVLDSHTVLA